MLLLILIPLLLVFTWCIIYPATDYYVRLLAPDIIRQGASSGKTICLTFDDGPDPVNTPDLLKILRTADIPAVFFLVGRKSDRYPELVKDILAAGHEIGSHTYYHRHAYFMFLKQSVNTISKGITSLEPLSGNPLVYFRPPWGALNLFQYIFLKKVGLKVVLWSANAVDWDIRTRPDQIMKRLERKARPGTIIVLHDSGGDPGAPQNMLNILPVIIARFKEQGYQFVTLHEIEGRNIS